MPDNPPAEGQSPIAATVTAGDTGTRASGADEYFDHTGYLFRHKVFACREINTLNFTTATKLNRELQSCGEEGVDWLLDEISFNSYSDFGAIFQKARRPGDEEISTAAILLADGELGAASRPIESGSVLFEAMGKPQKKITRVYYHGDIAKKVDKIIEAY